MPKILIASIDKYPPFRVDVNVLFGHELKRKGYEIDWLLQSEIPSKSHKVYDLGGVVWVAANYSGDSIGVKLKRQISRLINEFRILALILDGRYDIVQCKDICITSLLALSVCKIITKTKFVYWMSFPFPDAALERLNTPNPRFPVFYKVKGTVFRYLVYRLIMRNSDHVFVQSEQMKRDMISEGIDTHKLTAVPMGVSREMFDKVNNINPSNYVMSNARIRLGYLGTLERSRHIDFLVRVLSETRRLGWDTELWLIGGGKTDEDLEVINNEVQRLKLSDYVYISGFVPMEEAWRKILSSDICLSPFFPTPILNSTSPTKLVEYMALGKPVVANNHPEQSLIIKESGAGISVDYDEKSFACAISSLLKDKELMKVMSNKGREYVNNNRCYDVIAEMVDAMYSEIIQ